MIQKPVALVTGGAQRVGRAIVEQLAAAGFDIAFTYHRSAAAAETLKASLMGAGVRVSTAVADFENPIAATDAIEQMVTRHFGRLDVLINNASSFEAASLNEVTLDQMRRAWSVHLETPLMICQRLSPLLRASRGHIVNLLDLLAERPARGYLAYSASKAALANLTLSLARELAPEVTVNGIAPGVVQWPENYPKPSRERYLARVPLGRAGSPQDVAAAVTFFCSSASYITGQILRLDGGRSIT